MEDRGELIVSEQRQKPLSYIQERPTYYPSLGHKDTKDEQRSFVETERMKDKQKNLKGLRKQITT